MFELPRRMSFRVISTRGQAEVEEFLETTSANFQLRPCGIMQQIKRAQGRLFSLKKLIEHKAYQPRVYEFSSKVLAQTKQFYTSEHFSLNLPAPNSTEPTHANIVIKDLLIFCIISIRNSLILKVPGGT